MQSLRRFAPVVTAGISAFAFSVLLTLLATPASAQIRPRDVWEYKVDVTPDGSTTPDRPPNSGPYSAKFYVRNTGSYPDTYTLTCSSSTNVTCTGLSRSSVTLSPGTQAAVYAYYTVGVVGPGTLTVRARSDESGVQDTGYFNVPVVGSSGVTPIVSPDADTTLVFRSQTGLSQRFLVKNVDTLSHGYTIAATCTGAATGCSVTPSSITLAAGESRSMTVTYQTNTSASGLVKLMGTQTDQPTVKDSGWVPLATVATPAPVVSLAANPGNAIERGLCLTIAAGAAAAIECGDLRIVHALPAIRTLNKTRQPVLLYNSATARSYPLIVGHVTRAAGSATPDSVEAILRVNGVQRASGRWAGSDWPAGGTRQIALGYDATADTTGIYSFTLEAATLYAGGRYATTLSGKLIVVNRSGSEFGAGWWLAGFERLRVAPNNGRLWIGGDGSAREYRSAGANVWVGSGVTRPDTIKLIGADYVRVLASGDTVKFDGTGWHERTVNRLGHQTVFTPVSGRLGSITLPSQGGGQQYSFSYTSGKLTSVTAPPNGSQTRVTTITQTSGRVDQIRDPDNSTVSFGDYSSNRIGQRTDRRGTVTRYGFDGANKVWRVKIELSASDSIRTEYYNWERRGLVTEATKTAWDTASVYSIFYGARHFATGADQITQWTRFWVDRYGAPRKIQDVANSTTILTRGDAQYPALPTEIQGPDGFVTKATYDGRGNILMHTAVNPLGSGQDAVTSYRWDPKWNLVTRMATPMGVVTTLAYDAANGNRLWQQVGSDPARRVTFRHGNTLGLLSSTVLPQTSPDSLLYDTRGNLTAARTPVGFWTSYYKDATGRDTLTVTPIASTDTSRGGAPDSTARLRNRTVYTVMDRDSIIEAIAPNRAELVRVNKSYDGEGNLLSLTRRSVPDVTNPAIGEVTTTWRYDRANRRVAEVAPDGYVDSTRYDPAGNVIAAVTRRSDPTTGARLVINMSYDALDRLVTRVLPQVAYQSRATGFNIHPPQGRFDIQDYPAYVIAAQTDTFTYDVMGRLLTADNPDAKVKRSYYPGGLLKTDSLRIQTVARNNWETHKYGLRHTYDLDGRRLVLAVPSQLGIGGDTTISYTYEAQTGLLQSLQDLQDNSYTFGYTPRGELSAAAYPGAYSRGLRYDADGRLTSDTIRNNGGATFPRIESALVRATGLFYDARDKLLVSGDPVYFRDTVHAAYSGLGNLQTTLWIQHGVANRGLGPGYRYETAETHNQDGMANRTLSSVIEQRTDDWGGYFSSGSCCDTLQYQPGTGRLTRMARPYSTSPFLPSRSYSYDQAGNQIFEQALDASRTSTERASFFAADQSLRMVDSRTAANDHAPATYPQQYAVEDYRYDALGRRVWLRARRWCDDTGLDRKAGTECRSGLIRRTIWDGEQELVEIQMPWALQGKDLYAKWDTTQTPEWWENDTAPVPLGRLDTMDPSTGDPNPLFGRVIYAGFTGTDQPLAVTRVNYVWRSDWYYPNNTYSPQTEPPFTITPFWSAQGDVPLGVMTGGVLTNCDGPTPYEKCVGYYWPWYISSLDRQKNSVRGVWHGTLLESKRDESGLGYLRNRYYDPATGRFTQEDPIGLAGGLNLYGFANGDPVNFSDPFGLCVFSNSTASCFQLLANWGAGTGRGWAVNLGAALEALTAAGEAAMGGGCDHGVSCGLGLPGAPGGGSIFSGSRAALRQTMNTGWLEGVSGRQGLRILERLKKGRVDEVAVAAGEGRNVIASFTKLLEKGREVTVRTYNAAGDEISTIRRIYDEAGNLVREGVIR